MFAEEATHDDIIEAKEFYIQLYFERYTCTDPGIFIRGGPGQSYKKSSDNVFFFSFFNFLVLSLFYRSQMVNFKEIYHFSRFQRGSNIFQGGGGVQLLIPYRSPCNL